VAAERTWQEGEKKKEDFCHGKAVGVEVGKGREEKGGIISQRTLQT